MKLTTKSRYALRAATELAKSGAWVGNSSKAMKIETISKRQDISEHYMRQIAVALRRSEIVISRRGVGGGLLLTKKPQDITSLQILLAMDENLHLVSCLSDANKCNRTGDCPTRMLWGKLGSAIRDVLSSTTLYDLANYKSENAEENLCLPRGYEFSI